jgi:hypothetical protein
VLGWGASRALRRSYAFELWTVWYTRGCAAVLPCAFVPNTFSSIIQAGHSKIPPVPGKDQTLVTGNGGPSGTGKRPTGEPVLPPPVFIQDNNPAPLAATTTAAGAGAGAGVAGTGAATPAMVVPGIGVGIVTGRPAPVSRSGTATWGNPNTLAAIVGNIDPALIGPPLPSPSSAAMPAPGLTPTGRSASHSATNSFGGEDGHSDMRLGLPPTHPNGAGIASGAATPAGSAAGVVTLPPPGGLKRGASNTSLNASTAPTTGPATPAAPTPSPAAPAPAAAATTAAAPVAPVAAKVKPKTAKEIAAEKKAALAAAKAAQAAEAAAATSADTESKTVAPTIPTPAAAAAPTAAAPTTAAAATANTTAAPAAATLTPTPKLTARQQMLQNKAEKAAARAERAAERAAEKAEKQAAAAANAASSAPASASNNAAATVQLTPGVAGRTGSAALGGEVVQTTTNVTASPLKVSAIIKRPESKGKAITPAPATNGASATAPGAASTVTPSTASLSSAAESVDIAPPLRLPEDSGTGSAAQPATLLSWSDAPRSYSRFNGLSANAVFPVPSSSLNCSIWSNILRASNDDLSINPYGLLTTPISELLDLTLPPGDALQSSGPVWPRPMTYYAAGMGNDGICSTPAGKHNHLRSVADMAQLPSLPPLPPPSLQPKSDAVFQRGTAPHTAPNGALGALPTPSVVQPPKTAKAGREEGSVERATREYRERPVTLNAAGAAVTHVAPAHAATVPPTPAATPASTSGAPSPAPAAAPASAQNASMSALRQLFPGVKLSVSGATAAAATTGKK